MLPRSSTNSRSGRARCELRPAPHRAGGDRRSDGQVDQRSADQRVGGGSSLGVGPDHETVVGRGRQILGGVDRDVGAPVEHRQLDLLDEHPLPTDRVERYVAGLGAVTVRVDQHQSGDQTGPAQQVGDVLGLGDGLGTATGGDPDRLQVQDGSAEVEQIGDGRRVALTLRRAGLVAEAHRRLVQQLGHEPTGDRLDQLTLFGSSRWASRLAYRSSSAARCASARWRSAETSGAACSAADSTANRSTSSLTMRSTWSTSPSRCDRPRSAHAPRSSRSSTVTSSSSATSGATSRGTAMSTNSSGRPLRGTSCISSGVTIGVPDPVQVSTTSASSMRFDQMVHSERQTVDAVGERSAHDRASG